MRTRVSGTNRYLGACARADLLTRRRDSEASVRSTRENFCDLRCENAHFSCDLHAKTGVLNRAIGGKPGKARDRVTIRVTDDSRKGALKVTDDKRLTCHYLNRWPY